MLMRSGGILMWTGFPCGGPRPCRSRWEIGMPLPWILGSWDPWRRRRSGLAHELGHCETGSFYNQYAALDVRQRHENRADKWAIWHLVPEDALDQAVADGYTDLPSLAEHFCVTVPFMRKAVCWYTHGNLAAELYF